MHKGLANGPNDAVGTPQALQTNGVQSSGLGNQGGGYGAVTNRNGPGSKNDRTYSLPSAGG